MDIYDEIENLTRGLPPDQKILEANRLKNIYCNIGYMDTESQRLRKLRSHGLTTTLNAELNIAPDSDITLTQQFLDNFPANYNRYMEAYKHSIRLLSDLQQLYAIIVVNMNRGESYLFKGNDQISNFFSIFKDRLYPQLQPLDRTSNYLFLYCSNDIDIFIAKKALNLCSIHQVTPIDMAQIRRIQKAQKTVEKHDATQIPQTMINRPLGESGKNDGKSTELPNVTTASGSMNKESNTINNLNLEPAMEKSRLSDLDRIGRGSTAPRFGPHSRPPSPPSPSPPPNPDVFRRRDFSQSSAQSSRPSPTQTTFYSVQTMANRTPQQSTSRPSPPRTVRRERQISDPIPKESASKTVEDSSISINQPSLSTINAFSKNLSPMMIPYLSPIVQNLKTKAPKPHTGTLQIDPKYLTEEKRIPGEKEIMRVRKPEPPKESDDMELTRLSTPQQIREAHLKALDKSVDKIEKILREFREQEEREKREKRVRAVERRLKPQAKVLIEDLKKRRREKQETTTKKLKEKRLSKAREQPGEKELKEKQLKEAQEQQKQQEEKLREQQEQEGKELRENILKGIELRRAQEREEKDLREKRIREAREQHEKDLREKRLKEKQLKKQQEKELLSQTPTRELEFTSSPSPIKQTDASKVDIKEPEFQTQTPSPSTSKKIVEEIQEIQGAKKGFAKKRGQKSYKKP